MSDHPRAKQAHGPFQLRHIGSRGLLSGRSLAVAIITAMIALVGITTHFARPTGSVAPAATSGKDEGRVGYRLDANSTWSPYVSDCSFIKAHMAKIMGYGSTAYQFAQCGVPTEGYHDPYTDGNAPLDSSQIQIYVNKMNSDMANGLVGVMIDDSNWGTQNSPGPNANLANLFVALRQAQPNAKIEMNSQFWDIWPKMQAGNQSVELALSKVNYVTKEFGVGPTAGINTPVKYAEYFQYVDTLHAMGVHVVVTGDQNAATPAGYEYNTASLLLINDGGDFVNGHGQLPTNWWPGFNVNLGDATSARTRSTSGLWTRTFVTGVVYTVEPGGATQTFSVPPGLRDVYGTPVSSVTLSGGSGKILIGSNTITPPPPSPSPSAICSACFTPSPSASPHASPSPSPSVSPPPSAVAISGPCTITLNGSQQVGTCNGTFSSCPPTIQQGASGSVVMTMQTALNNHGANPQLVVDGSFGPLTNNAVVTFQSNHGLTANGIVDANTWHALGVC